MCRQPRCIEAYYIARWSKWACYSFGILQLIEIWWFLQKCQRIYAGWLDVSPPCNVYYIHTYYCRMYDIFYSTIYIYVYLTYIAYMCIYLFIRSVCNYINTYTHVADTYMYIIFTHTYIYIIQRPCHFGAKSQVENGLLWSGPSVWWFQKSNCWKRTRQLHVVDIPFRNVREIWAFV